MSSSAGKFIKLVFNEVIFLKKIGIDSVTKQPLQGMELQEKEAQKDYIIQGICLEGTYG